MEIEKKLIVAAPVERVWELVLDPQVMAGCVPGTESVDVLSDVLYSAVIKVKISFISARFKIKTEILEKRPPYYARCEGTGEDSGIGSAMKQSSEMFLTDLGDGTTELRIKVKVDVFGKLGSFGLSVMKTKADRMWEEFGENFLAHAVPDPALRTPDVRPPPVDSISTPHPVVLPTAPRHDESSLQKAGWLQRIFSLPGVGRLQEGGRLPTDIYVEIARAEGTVKILWPAESAEECASWLREYLK